MLDEYSGYGEREAGKLPSVNPAYKVKAVFLDELTHNR